jgi:hypothetical protein
MIEIDCHKVGGRRRGCGESHGVATAIPLPKRLKLEKGRERYFSTAAWLRPGRTWQMADRDAHLNLPAPPEPEASRRGEGNEFERDVIESASNQTRRRYDERSAAGTSKNCKTAHLISEMAKRMAARS